MTYKDQIREDALKGKMSDEEDNFTFSKKKNDGKETIAEEEARLKKEFKQAALKSDDEDADGFLVKKEDKDDVDGDEKIPDNIEEL